MTGEKLPWGNRRDALVGALVMGVMVAVVPTYSLGFAILGAGLALMALIGIMFSNAWQARWLAGLAILVGFFFFGLRLALGATGQAWPVWAMLPMLLLAASWPLLHSPSSQTFAHKVAGFHTQPAGRITLVVLLLLPALLRGLPGLPAALLSTYLGFLVAVLTSLLLHGLVHRILDGEG